MTQTLQLQARSNKPLVVAFVMGGTCAGKSTLLAYAKRTAPERVGLVEVGKLLRAKYPPDYFDGEAAPKHTQKEAWELFLSKTAERMRNPEIDLILVDGQPRDVDQACGIIGLNFDSYRPVWKRFLYLYAPRDIQEERAAARHLSHSTAGDLKERSAYDLAMDRIENDRRAYCDVLVTLVSNNVPVQVIESYGPEWGRPFGRMHVVVDQSLSSLPIDGNEWMSLYKEAA